MFYRRVFFSLTQYTILSMIAAIVIARVIKKINATILAACEKHTSYIEAGQAKLYQFDCIA